MNDRSPANSDCSSQDELWRLVAGQVSPEVEAQLTQHISDCPKCRALLDQAVPEEITRSTRNALKGDNNLPKALADLLQIAKTDLTEAGQRLSDEQVSDDGRPQDSVTAWADLKPWLRDTTHEALGTLDGWALQEFIGRGGMGLVFRTRDPALHRDVALKVLSPFLACDPACRTRFLREARSVAALRHPSIVGIHQIQPDFDLPYLVMELISGPSLADYMHDNGPLRVREVLRISRQVSEGLEVAHNAGILHRDIKPANILLDPATSRARITDFGLARSDSDQRLTTTGGLMGTPAYMAPETVAEQPQDQRTDLFSLGVVMYEMLSGHLPFEAETTIGTIKKISTGQFESLRRRMQNIRPEPAAIVDRLLAGNPSDRYQTARELNHDLKRISRPRPAATASSFGRLPAWKWISYPAAALSIAISSVGLYRVLMPPDPQASPGGSGTGRGTASSSDTRPEDGRESGETASESQAGSGGFISYRSSGERIGQYPTLPAAIASLNEGGRIEVTGIQDRILENPLRLEYPIEIQGVDEFPAHLIAGFSEPEPLIETSAPLTLIHVTMSGVKAQPDTEEFHDRSLIIASDTELTCRDCRFEQDAGVAIRLYDAASCSLTDCELINPRGDGLVWSADSSTGRLQLSNCRIVASMGILFDGNGPGTARITNCRVAGDIVMGIDAESADDYSGVNITADSSFFLATDVVVRVHAANPREAVSGRELGFTWSGQNNAWSYPICRMQIEGREDDEEDSVLWELETIKAWESLDGITEEDGQTRRPEDKQEVVRLLTEGAEAEAREPLITAITTLLEE